MDLTALQIADPETLLTDLAPRVRQGGSIEQAGMGCDWGRIDVTPWCPRNDWGFGGRRPGFRDFYPRSGFSGTPCHTQESG